MRTTARRSRRRCKSSTDEPSGTEIGTEGFNALKHGFHFGIAGVRLRPKQFPGCIRTRGRGSGNRIRFADRSREAPYRIRLIHFPHAGSDFHRQIRPQYIGEILFVGKKAILSGHRRPGLVPRKIPKLPQHRAGRGIRRVRTMIRFGLSMLPCPSAHRRQDSDVQFRFARRSVACYLHL
jgi:hypothetical protein